jgi:Icc-related predicted phosphoesterase
MKVQILSDLHIEFQPFRIPATDADVVILAGDIHVAKKGVIWAKENIQDKPVLYVLGNHEYYGKAYPKLVDDLKELAIESNVIILENDSIEIDGVRFLGCTLWTDFKLFGDPRVAGYNASEKMNDYRKIRVSPEYRKLRSIDASVIHNKSRSFLEKAFATNPDIPTVVITHHAPSIRSLSAHRHDDLLSAAYVSALDELVAASRAKLWIHGHIHTQQDYWIGETRVICNPRGYPDKPNPLFQPDLVIGLNLALQ